jgi:hypothetical protein
VLLCSIIDCRYDTQSIIGYNCRFLQGADSDAREIYRLKVAVERGKEEEEEGTAIAFYSRI